MDRILVKGLLPGGPRHERVDNFSVEPEGFAKKIAQAKAGPQPTMLTWKDPVHDLHMRTKSDIVRIYSGTLMYEDNVTIWWSSDTKDYLTPDIVRRGCLPSVRTRE